MTIAPGKVRLQVAVPAALKVELDQLAATAGVHTNTLAATFLAMAVAQSRPPAASPVDAVPRQRISRPTWSKRTPESESLRGDDADGFSAAQILAALSPDDRAALLAEGWSEELIDDVLYKPGDDDEGDND